MPTTTKPQECFCEVLAYHEAFRRLGFPASDIYLLVCPGTIGCILRTQGREFTVVVPPYDGDDAKKAWAEAVRWWKETTNDARMEVWVNSYAANNSMQLLTALMNKGISWAGREELVRDKRAGLKPSDAVDLKLAELLGRQLDAKEAPSAAESE